MTVAVPVPGDALARFSEVPFRIAVQVDITGCEDIGPEGTFDGDYGRLLERAYEKGEGWRPQRDSVPLTR